MTDRVIGRLTLRLVRRGALLVLGLVAGGLLLAAPATAHATVVASSPADGSRLAAAPHAVTITFDENVGIDNGVGYLHVTSQTGQRVDARAAFHPGGDGTKVTDDLRGGLGDGTYTASFRVISADSHPIAGTLRFVVGNGALAHGTLSGSAVDRTTSVTFDVARWVSFAGLALLGGSWLVLTIWPGGRDDRRARQIVWTGWGAAVVGGVAELLLQGPFTAGTGPSQWFSWSLLDGTLHTDFGQLHCARLVFLGLLAVLFGRSLQADARPAPWEVQAGALGIGVVATFSASGHPSSTSPSWLSMPVDALHLISMAVWLGGLVMLVLAVLPRRDPDELRVVLPVFSTVAFAAVVVLAASGTYAAWRGIGTVHAIFTTTYGLLVVAKIVLFAGLLALGNVSRLLVRRRTVAYAMTDSAVLDEPAADTEDTDVERLRRSVLIEALVGVIVLAVTAVLVAEPRGKEALVASYREPVSATASLGGGHSVTVTADPGVHGPIDVTVTLSAGVRASSITATATQKSAEIGPLPVKLTRRGAGSYDGSVALPVAGSWDVDLVVTASQFAATTTDVTLHLH